MLSCDDDFFHFSIMIDTQTKTTGATQAHRCTNAALDPIGDVWRGVKLETDKSEKNKRAIS